uniref:Uncharacterized protein n=1 Tax=Anguilla anguilla TaxID=7936 RepID=A0A0E9RHG2_ANGAN
MTNSRVTDGNSRVKLSVIILGCISLMIFYINK